MNKVYYIGKDNQVKIGTDFSDVENEKHYMGEWSRNKKDMENILKQEKVNKGLKLRTIVGILSFIIGVLIISTPFLYIGSFLNDKVDTFLSEIYFFDIIGFGVFCFFILVVNALSGVGSR